MKIGSFSKLGRLFTAGLLFFMATHAQSQDAAVVVLTEGPIPEDYETWSIFLVCSPTWFVEGQEDALPTLYEDFRTFGRFIGDDHLAVWFGTTSRILPEELAETFDHERNSEFCSKFGLDPDETPHVLVTDNYDVLVDTVEEIDADESIGDGAVRVDIIKFRGLPPREAPEVFNLLTRRVLEGVRVESEPAAGGFLAALRSLIDATANAVLGLSDAVSVSVDLKFVKVTVD